MRRFSRLRWIVLCLCGFRHREGEHWFTVGKGFAPKPLSRCTRCGVRSGGLAYWRERHSTPTMP